MNAARIIVTRPAAVPHHRARARRTTPEVVAVMPYAVVARVGEKTWQWFVSPDATPDAVALVIRRAPPVSFVNSHPSKDMALGAARHISNYYSTLMPFVRELGALLAAHNGAPASSVLTAWLRAVEPRLQAAEGPFLLRRDALEAWGPAEYTQFDPLRALGVLTHAAVRGRLEAAE